MGAMSPPYRRFLQIKKVLARLLRTIKTCDTLVVVRVDRLARSVSHLLAVIEQLEAAGA
jgi:DNA invertase Pin-like site-specific DNA recombinase